MPNFPPPPTYADPVIVDETTRRSQFNPLWFKWFLDLGAFVTTNGGGGLIQHNNLGALQGGSANEYYHLTASQHGALTAGFTGTGALVRQTSPILVTPNLGTPTAGVLSSCTGLPISTGVSGLGAGIATFLATPTSANLAIAVTDETGTGALLFNNAPAITDPTITGGRANSFNYINYTTTPTLPGTILEGTEYWDSGSGSLQVLLKGGNVTYIDGQQEYALCYNDAGVALTKGQVVYISGAQGNRVAIKLAQADSDANSAHTIGFVAESIAAGGEGWVHSSGPIYKLNTFGYTAGDTVYLSPTTPGAWTTTRPTAPNHTVILGFIERVHASVGSIYVKVDNGYELNELHNVKITSVANNDLLQYDSTGLFWKNVAPSSVTVGTATNVSGGTANVTDCKVTGSGSLGYGTGSGGAVTQATSRTTGVTLNKTNGAITLFSAAGTTTWQSFTVTNSTVAATDTVIVNQKSGTDLYMIHVTNVAAGSFQITFATTGGTTTEQPVFNFAIIKAVIS